MESSKTGSSPSGVAKVLKNSTDLGGGLYVL